MASSVTNGVETPLSHRLPTTEEPGVLHSVTSMLWDTVCSKAFACGALVGATLMYTGIRAIQNYLSESDPDTDHPF